MCERATVTNGVSYVKCEFRLHCALCPSETPCQFADENSHQPLLGKTGREPEREGEREADRNGH